MGDAVAPVKRKLLVLCTRLPTKEGAPNGMFVLEHVRALAPHFADVLVVAVMPRVRRDRGTLQDEELPSNVRLARVDYLGAPLVGLRRASALEAARRIRRLLEAQGFRPDVIHAHFTMLPGLVAKSLSRRLGVPYAVTIHESQDWFERELASRLCRGVWDKARFVIRVNPFDLPRLLKVNGSALYMANGYSRRRLAPMPRREAREALGIPPDARVVFSLGALIPRKGLDVLIEATAILRPQVAGLRVVIGGAGPERSALEAKAVKLRVDDVVAFAGRVPESTLSAYYHAADVVVVPSWSEGNPTVMFEAMGCGTPFVGTRVGGAPHVLRDPRLGTVVDPGDPHALAKATMTYLETPPDRNFIRAEASNYEWSGIGAATARLLLAACDGRDGDRGVLE